MDPRWRCETAASRGDDAKTTPTRREASRDPRWKRGNSRTESSQMKQEAGRSNVSRGSAAHCVRGVAERRSIGWIPAEKPVRVWNWLHRRHADRGSASSGFPISTGIQYCVIEKENGNGAGETARDQIQQQRRVTRVLARIQLGTDDRRNTHVGAPFHLLGELLGMRGETKSHIFTADTFL